MSKVLEQTAAAQTLLASVEEIRAGDCAGVIRLLAHPAWEHLEAYFWNASHPLPPEARIALEEYVSIATALWHKAGLGQAQPLALYKTTLLSAASIDTALRVLAKIYAGCNLGYRAPPAGFWRSVYALTGFLVSDRLPERDKTRPLIEQSLQLWLMAWLNPMSLAPGRLPVAVRLVGILSRTCSYTLTSPTHAGSGLAAADLLGDAPPMPFARVPAMWEPAAPLYVNAQDAAFAIRELGSPVARRQPSDAYESLLQCAQQVGLTSQEMQDFVRRAMREFGYSNARTIPRVGRSDTVNVVVGFIETWSALQAQTKTSTVTSKDGYATHTATVINHSDGGFLLRFELGLPLLCVGSMLALRGNAMEPWTIASIRWLEGLDGVVLAGCEVLCNFAEARVAQQGEGVQHMPVISYQKNDQSHVISPYARGEAASVSQLYVDAQCWVVAMASEMGEDWQRSAVLDATPAL